MNYLKKFIQNIFLFNDFIKICTKNNFKISIINFIYVIINIYEKCFKVKAKYINDDENIITTTTTNTTFTTITTNTTLI